MSLGKPSSVASRFVSQTELDASRSSSSSTSAQGADAEYDPRSLFERLQSNKDAKDAKYDEMYKLSNQFRGIDEGESEFLAQIEAARKKQEEEKRSREREELQAFRAAKSGTAKMDQPPQPPSVVVVKEKGENSKEDKVEANGKKKRKATSSLLGVVKKKTPAPLPAIKGVDKKQGDAMKSQLPSTSQPDSTTIHPKKT